MIFGTLSLDVTAPFVPQMGLQLPPGNAFTAGLRNLIEEFRSIQTEQGGVEPPFSRAVFNWAANEFCRGFADHLYAWGQDVFQTGDDGGVGVFLWDNIVRRGGLDGARDHRPPPHFVILLRSMLAQRSKAPVNRITPTSAWDKKLYERQHYDRYRKPMALVQATINYYDFVSAWQDAVTAADQLDLQQLKKWGTEEALILGMPLDRLGNPGAWPPLPPPWR